MGSVTTPLRAPPSRFPAGDTLDFLQAIPGDYTGWTGSARLTGPSTMDATSCDTEGSDFHVIFSGQGAGGTKELEPGEYRLSVFATQGANRYTVAQYGVSIALDPATATDGEGSHATRMLAIIERAIEARLSGNDDGGIESYIIDGVSITKTSDARLQLLRARYKAEVAAEQNGGKLPSLAAVFTSYGDLAPIRSR